MPETAWVLFVSVAVKIPDSGFVMRVLNRYLFYTPQECKAGGNLVLLRTVSFGHVPEERAKIRETGEDYVDIIQQITLEMAGMPNHDGSKVRKGQIEAAVKLIDEGNTIPFIARYRKEATGALDDEQLRFLGERLSALRNLEDKKQQVLSAIEEQGKLTKELRSQIEAAMTQVAVDDLYRPYKQKRKTRAGIAKEKGLEPFADAIMNGTVQQELEKEAVKYVTPAEKLDDPEIPEEQKVKTPEEALQGALDIVAERISDDAGLRTWIREKTWKSGTIASAEKKESTAKAAAKGAKAAGAENAETKAAATTAKAGSTAALHGTKEDRRAVYEMYFEFEESIAKLPGHRTLALNRGEREKYLTVSINAPEEEIVEHILRWLYHEPEKAKKEQPAAQTRRQPEKGLDLSKLSWAQNGYGNANGKQNGKQNGKPAPQKVVASAAAAGALQKSQPAGGKTVKNGAGKRNPYTEAALRAAAEDAYERLIQPSIEREIRNQLTEEAEDGAIKVFRKNLEQLLMQPPISGQVVLGWDPAFRTGCKISVVDPTGKVLDTTVIYPTAPQNRVAEAKSVIKKLVAKDNVSLISLGNGTASRESEQIIVELIHEIQKENPGKKPLQYIVVNEAGASVYSASKLATEEFPNFDVGQRSATSMARRLQDPLAELVKIDPKAVGVGQYQHDMNQKKLDEALGGVVEDCVNHVGVDLNTASFSLLSYVSGISQTLAKNIVAYREANGSFRSRRELLKVAKLGPKAYEQCAGFLRIRDGKEPLDATAVHPENYSAVEQLLESLSLPDTMEGFREVKKHIGKGQIAGTAKELGIGELTLTDILNELEKPARDPRDEMPAPILRSDVLSMEDLKPGMKLKGTVRNIVDFGAFVDIGVHQDGLVHISRICNRFIKHPLEVVSVGDVVDVTVVEVDARKKRIALSMVEN